MRIWAICVLLALSMCTVTPADLIAAEEKAPAKTPATEEQHDWSVYGGTAENNHYSTLTQINRNNVKQLVFAWSFDTQEQGGLQISPIIVAACSMG